MVKDLGNGFALIESSEDIPSQHKTVEDALKTYRGIQFSSGGILLASSDARIVKAAGKEALNLHGIAGCSENDNWTMFFMCKMNTEDRIRRAMEFVIERILAAGKKIK